MKKPGALNRNPLKSPQSRKWVDRRYKSSTELEFKRTERTSLTERFAFNSEPLYPAMAQRATSVEVLRILISIGPTETMHFQTWSDKAGNAPPLTAVDPKTGVSVTFPDLNSAPWRDVSDEFDHARTVPFPESEATTLLHQSADINEGHCDGCRQLPDENGTLQGTVKWVLQLSAGPRP